MRKFLHFDARDTDGTKFVWAIFSDNSEVQQVNANEIESFLSKQSQIENEQIIQEQIEQEQRENEIRELQIAIVEIKELQTAITEIKELQNVVAEIKELQIAVAEIERKQEEAIAAVELNPEIETK